MVWDSKNGKKVYFDGELTGESDDTKTPPICDDCPFLIAQAVNREYDFQGLIDEFAVLNVALTEGEIKDIIRKGSIAAVSPSSKLATTWGDLKVAR